MSVSIKKYTTGRFNKMINTVIKPTENVTTRSVLVNKILMRKSKFSNKLLIDKIATKNASSAVNLSFVYLTYQILEYCASWVYGPHVRV